MFVPKEIAPYLSMLAPMIAPQLGITKSLLLSQAGSWKERGGKWDPYSALATGIALSSPQARAIREMGRIDPSKGTIGQRMSAGFGKKFTKPGTDASNWFNPTRKMDGNFASEFLRSNPDAADGIAYSLRTDSYGNTPVNEADWKKTTKKYEDWKYGTDMSVDDFIATDTFKEGIEKDPKSLEAWDAKDKLERQAYVDKLGLKNDPKYDPGFWGKAADFGSDLSGALFPGWYDSFDPVTGKGVGSLNFSNVVQTITVATTLGSVMAIKEEIEKEKNLDEAEERKIWKEWFNSYERTSGHSYEYSPYREPHLWEMHQKYMAKGGRVGYNLGGGIMEAPGLPQGMQAPGVPQGMQLDGRDGTFVPQGIEEKADDVPAMLSKNEFVLTADAMSGLDKIMGGQGDPRAAAQHMYKMMDQLEAVA